MFYEIPYSYWERKREAWDEGDPWSIQICDFDEDDEVDYIDELEEELDE